MITKILIFLVAVVLLIVIIAVLALRFLRADDNDTFDEIPDEPRRPGRSPVDDRRLEPIGAASERTRGVWAEPPRAKPPRAGRPPGSQRNARPPEGHGRNGYRERDSTPRPGSPEPRVSQNGGKRPATGARPAPASARSGRAARNADADTMRWESLSDVDYWAELSSDKTLTAAGAGPTNSTPVPSDSASMSHRGPDPAEPRKSANGRTAGRGDNGSRLPVRHRSQPRAAIPDRAADPVPSDPRPTHAPGRFAGSITESGSQSFAALARLADQQPPTGSRPSQPPRSRAAQPQPPARQALPPAPPQPPARQALPPGQAASVSYPNGRGRLPIHRDDDPLTSPSFPAINADDGRSYRGRRSGGHPTMPPGTNGRSEPNRQLPQYPADASASNGNGYAARSASSPPALPAPSAAGAPAGNPYGSFVGQPASSYQDQSPAVQQGAGTYGSYNGASQQPPSANGSWYGASDGYLPAPSHANGANGTNGTNGYHAGQYQPAAYQSAAYPGGPAEPTAYPQQSYLAGNGQYDQLGYPAPDAGYRRDGYQGYSGEYGGR